MDFPTGQDKAIYVYKFLKGPVREKCSYFMSTLTEHSYKHMLCFLDDGYGTDESYDLVAIERLAALPKLSELNQDNVLDHLAVIGAATGPLMKLSPEALRTPNGEKYFRLLRTLPIRDQDQYFTECRMLKAPRTLETLTSFLRSKLRDRKHGRSLYQPETEKKPRKTKGRWNWRQQGNIPCNLNVPEEVSEESEYSSAESEEGETKANYAVTESQCMACEEKHSLDKCPKLRNLDMDSKEKISALTRELPKLLMGGGIKICKIYCNSPMALKETDLELLVNDITIEDQDVIYEDQKVLGMIYIPRTDNFTFKVRYSTLQEWKSNLGIDSWTKRLILKVTASHYDPLGLISPVTIRPRKLLQALWKTGISWDNPIPKTFALGSHPRRTPPSGITDLRSMGQAEA